MDIIALSNKLLSQYGYCNWKVEFDSSNAFAGKTIYSSNTLVFAECLKNMNDNIIKDVVIHEIAHVRAGEFVESHGKYWRSLAVSMGGTGNRRISETIKKIFKNIVRRININCIRIIECFK